MRTRLVAVDTHHGRATLWELGNDNPEDPKRNTFGESGVLDALLSPDGRMLLTGGGGEGATGVWDVVSGKPVLAMMERGGNARPAFPAIAWSPDGTRVAVGFARDRFTTIWSVAPGKEKK